MSALEKPIFTLEIPQDTEVDLVTAYELWHQERTMPQSGQTDLFTANVVARQADVALAARQQYEESINLDSCGTTIYGIVIEHLRKTGSLPEEGIDSESTLKAAAASAPEYTGLPTPGEAMLVTIENLVTARKYAKAMEDHVEGIAMSGSNTWGSFYAVRSEHSKEGRSDIDLVVEVADLEHMEAALNSLIEQGLVNTPRETEPHILDEQRRLQQFKSLYMQDAADIFSLRSFATGMEASIHFVPSHTMDEITAHSINMRTTTVDTHAITYIRDFRPNQARNAANGGYRIHDFRGFTDIRFTPEPITVADSDNHVLGYISESPLGTTIETPKGKSYGLGVLTFFLSISPVVLAEKQGSMQRRIANMQRSIGETLGGARPEALIREDRMPEFARNAIKNALTLRYGNDTKAAA